VKRGEREREEEGWSGTHTGGRRIGVRDIAGAGLEANDLAFGA
jgi:hypothetical protein